MAYPGNDNVHTQTFTPREYQVELVDAAKKRNTIICSSSSGAKLFISLKLLQELAAPLRSGAKKKALFIFDGPNLKTMELNIGLQTDLTVISISLDDRDHNSLDTVIKNHAVIVTCIDMALFMLYCKFLTFEDIHLMVIDNCLSGYHKIGIEDIMQLYKNWTGEQPRVLGLAAGLLGPDLRGECLEAELERLESLVCSSVVTSSELVTLLQSCTRPREYIVECHAPKETSFLQQKIVKMVRDAQEFVREYRSDINALYAEQFLEDLLRQDDPKEQPLKYLDTFVDILTDLGLWAANETALNLLTLVEEQKTKVGYVDHLLLLCIVTTLLVQFRALCDHEFGQLDEYDRIIKYSTPKVLRLLEILKEFKPTGPRPAPEVVESTCDNESTSSALPAGSQTTRKQKTRPRKPFQLRTQQDDNLCSLILVRDRYVAKAIHSLLRVLSQYDEWWWVSALYTFEKIADPIKEPRDAEKEHRRQEDVLHKFRVHDCNIMVATAVLEYGCELPKCNLVIRFDQATNIHSYELSKARARTTDAYYIHLVNMEETDAYINSLAEFRVVERILLDRSHALEPLAHDIRDANFLTSVCLPYKPLSGPDAPCVTLATSIAVVNRYCAKLPSDTFTRLTPVCHITEENNKFTCTLRLPINSPLKKEIIGPPMQNMPLALRTVAFITCQMLHQVGELDDNLQPIGKESFRALDEDWNNFALEETDEELAQDDVEPRPGTTKRRQYYYKKVADCLTNCKPVVEKPIYFYKINMTLTCPLPEEQNTRGRRIYAPEESVQGFGILTSKEIPKICPFPIFTRSGEVQVDLELCSTNLTVPEFELKQISEFVNYTFTNVLRLQRYLMLFDPTSSDNSYLITPTSELDCGLTVVDWDFLDVIYANRNVLLETIPEALRTEYAFDPAKYKDAVVMPWYRNQDQPQYFYVAEICSHLSPKSNFPGSEYATFEEYYFRKYGIEIQNKEQYLLDVDHTSARLNFLTPRYVNRKGVALPTSSEETKRAKRENLEQKQILVPELCAVHPFTASLWRKAVCLPCILYRINALLLADEFRKTVAVELGLGQPTVDEDFEWPPLNFGWNLSEVLKKSKASEIKLQEPTPIGKELKIIQLSEISEKFCESLAEMSIDNEEHLRIIQKKSLKNDDSGEASGSNEFGETLLEIGTWSNDMVAPEDTDGVPVRYVSPTSWIQNVYDYYSVSEESDSSADDSEECGGVRIEFMEDNTAEAVDEDRNDIENPQEQFIPLETVWSSITTTERSKSLKEMFFLEASINKLFTNKVVLYNFHEFKRAEKQVKETFTLPLFTDYDISFSDYISEYVYNAILISETTTQDYNLLPQHVPTTPPAFSFDKQPDLTSHPGPSPSVILQALTMSNANDGINLERLETIGDSFLKYAITSYLYTMYENVHEGKLSHLRSKQVSNLNLYRLGKQKVLGECMIATKFDPHDNWLPPCFYVPKELEEALMDARVPANYWTPAAVAATRDMTLEEICQMVREHGETLEIPSIIPYNLVTQHSIPDKSIADCVEALIGAYLIECGPRGALLFMAWLGIRVLPQNKDGTYGELQCPNSPLLRNVPNPEEELMRLLDGYAEFETRIGYTFRDKSYLLQALTHASYSYNRLTDCYQRLEFLGDAVLDYLITRQLYEDDRMHSPGSLTDLRSALVNNMIFASLAVRHGFHRYFRHLSPGLQEVIERFVTYQAESGHMVADELYLLAEHECEDVEDVEVPKALGDIFESVAGAIYLDSGMSLDAVWDVYYRMMYQEIERFSDKVPKSPIRELLELEPETAKFGMPEKLADGRRVRVTVEVFGKGVYKGIGRNYRIAKCTAAKCALKHLKRSIRKDN